MGRKRKKRRKSPTSSGSAASKPSSRAQSTQEAVSPEPPSSSEEHAAPQAMHGMDRRLTLFAFLLLVGVALFVPPLLGQKLTQEYTRFSEQTLKQIESGDVSALRAGLIPEFQKEMSESALQNWLENKSLYQTGRLTPLWEQRQGRRAVVRARFSGGMLTALFAAPPDLSFSNTWQLANLCHTEREQQRTLERFLDYLHARNYALAYTLTAESVIEDRNELQRWSQEVNSHTWPPADAWTWEALELDEQGGLRLKGRAQTEAGVLHVNSLWIERPESCDYLLQELTLDSSSGS